ncbi:MAG: TauD/TfdA family dioxygenase, partial [Emcibacteraceae bacterium]|nr:TauD/TfdA family dioxygenase [Emcibacteraceae bacterium]
GVILIRNQQHLTPKNLNDFAAIFGSVEKNEKYNPEFILPNHPEILRLGTLKENGKRRALWIKSDDETLWHSDDTFRDPQPIGSCLFCVTAPKEGAATWYAGMSHAYDALPEHLKEKIETLTAVHSYNHLNEILCQVNPHRPKLSAEMKAKLPPITRPLVAVHPVTRKKSIYATNIHMEKINGMDDDEARSLLAELLSHATKPEFAFAHAWQVGDLILWDNRCAMHAPSPFDDSKYERLMYRLTVNGEQIDGF